MMVKRCIIGLVGLPGSGKTTAAKYLEKQGFINVTLSDFIKEEIHKAKAPGISREVLQDFGNTMRETYGPQILAQLALKKVRELKTKKVVIDGIRNLYEVAYLEVENNFTLVGITAKPKIRYERLLYRKGRKLIGTYRDFLHHEAREDTLGSKETGLRVKGCLKKVKFIVRNNTTEKDFYDSITALAKTATLT